jgi:hypothetical protein
MKRTAGGEPPFGKREAEIARKLHKGHRDHHRSAGVCGEYYKSGVVKPAESHFSICHISAEKKRGFRRNENLSPFKFLSRSAGAEFFFSRSAFRAYPFIIYILEGRARHYAVIGIAELRVVDIAA